MFSYNQFCDSYIFLCSMGASTSASLLAASVVFGFRFLLYLSVLRYAICDIESSDLFPGVTVVFKREHLEDRIPEIGEPKNYKQFAECW